MKTKHKVAIILALLGLFGVLFGPSVTEYTKHKLNPPAPTAEHPQPTPKKVRYTFVVSREVE
ncbi:MAG: hypothetical protein EOO60_03885 [Hymenobacter sp.]|nr:MAG: hypothetical protein EOO60_03885 [Hymenobacter sp.]